MIRRLITEIRSSQHAELAITSVSVAVWILLNKTSLPLNHRILNCTELSSTTPYSCSPQLPSIHPGDPPCMWRS